MRIIYSAVAIILIAVTLTDYSRAQEFRSIDGSGNNATNSFGIAGSQLTRTLGIGFEDGISTPRGGMNSSLPSPRLISNVVADQPQNAPNFLGASDWLWQWGQFLDHDLDLTLAGGSGFDIQVPQGDVHFDPGNSGNAVIPFSRSTSRTGTGTSTSNPLQHSNEITAFIDGSNIYGSDVTRAAALRTGAGLGQLTISLANNGEVLPMRNTVGLENDNGGGTNNADFFLSGDIRANEQIGLTATHSLFVREHNRIASSINSRLESQESFLLDRENAAISDTTNNVNNRDDFVFECSRLVVGSLMQKVTYEEFLPVLIGNELASYSGYDSSVDAGISTEFSTAAFRLGHTLLSPTLRRPGVGDIDLADAFFNPEEVQMHGVDTLLLGLSQQESQALDHMLDDGVRNFLFGPPGAGGLDLASLNIQRGRDHGLPGYTDSVFSIFGTEISDFDDLGSAGLGLIDDDVVSLLEQAYENVEDIDLWIGGISETPDDHGGLLGPTFTALLADQFQRTRDGDRFFYLDSSLLADLTMLDPNFDSTLLSDIILRNSSIDSINRNVFFVSAVPEPNAVAVLAIFAFACGTRRKRRRDV